MPPKILIFTGFVGGRGGSKKAAWLYSELKSRNYHPIVVSEQSYLYKIGDLEMKPDILIQKKPSHQQTYQDCWHKLKDLNFDYLISFGPRTFGPWVAYKRNLPYTIIDGGLPPYQKDFPSDHFKEVYQNCRHYILTCHFPWNFPQTNLPQAVTKTQPYPFKRVQKYQKLRNLTKPELTQQLINKFPELKQDYDLFIYLNITDEYVDPNFIEPKGWLKEKEFHQTVNFIRNLITGLGQQDQKILIYMEKKLVDCIADLLKKFPHLKTFNRDFIYPDTDILLKKLADLNICRAARCDKQSELALIGKACITTPCPLNYMDEDTAALQAKALGLTKLIPLNHPQYTKKIIAFSQNLKLQKQIENNLTKTFDQMWKKNNPWTTLLLELNS